MRSDSVPKLGLVSHVLPPSSSGQAIVLYRLLRDWDPRQYCLISLKDYVGSRQTCVKDLNDHVTHRLSGAYYHLPAEARFRILESRPFQWARKLVAAARSSTRHAKPTVIVGSDKTSQTDSSPSVTAPAQKSLLGRWKTGCRSVLQRWDDWVNLRTQVKQRAKSIYRVMRQENCTALVACSGDLIDLPAGFLAAQWAGIPFYPYMFDDYAQQWVSPSQQAFAQSACHEMFEHAAGVIVPNEFLARAYRDAYGVECAIIRNPVASMHPLGERAQRNGPYRVVFTGTIYQAHFDAFRRLLAALQRFDPRSIELHLYTSSDPRFLAENGIGSPAKIHASVTNQEAVQLQESADLLFLPLAFFSPYPEIINTSAPGKMGEYLASGRPILVHAPKDSFLSWYCRTHQCAAVVDLPDVDLLRRTITELMQQQALVDTLVENGWRRAQEDFHLSRVQARFSKLFSKARSQAA